MTSPLVLIREGGGTITVGGRGGGAGLFLVTKDVNVEGGGGRGLADPLDGVGGAGLFPFSLFLAFALLVVVVMVLVLVVLVVLVVGGLLPVGGGGCDIVVAAAIGIGSSWRWFEMLIVSIVD